MICTLFKLHPISIVKEPKVLNTAELDFLRIGLESDFEAVLKVEVGKFRNVTEVFLANPLGPGWV